MRRGGVSGRITRPVRLRILLRLTAAAPDSAILATSVADAPLNPARPATSPPGNLAEGAKAERFQRCVGESRSQEGEGTSRRSEADQDGRPRVPLEAFSLG